MLVLASVTNGPVLRRHAAPRPAVFPNVEWSSQASLRKGSSIMVEQAASPPGQQQQPPGSSGDMDPNPHDEMRSYEGRGLLSGHRALITGGDSGIGRATAVAFAKEGADVAVVYFDSSEDQDAEHTARLVEQQNRRCLRYRGDLASEEFCEQVVEQAAGEFGGLDVLVNHAGTQATAPDLRELSTEAFDRTFKQRVQRLLDHPSSPAPPAQPSGDHQYRLGERTAGKQVHGGLRGEQVRHPHVHQVVGAVVGTKRSSGQLHRARSGVDTADPRSCPRSAGNGR